MNFTTTPKFRLGQIVATPIAIKTLERSRQTPNEFLSKHQNAEWGELCNEDKQANDQAIKYEGEPDKQQRVLSSYQTKQGEKIWIITEWDRSVTTILLPEEY